MLECFGHSVFWQDILGLVPSYVEGRWGRNAWKYNLTVTKNIISDDFIALGNIFHSQNKASEQNVKVLYSQNNVIPRNLYVFVHCIISTSDP